MLRPLASAATRVRAAVPARHSPAAPSVGARPTISPVRLLARQRRALRSSLTVGAYLLAALAPIIGAGIAVLYPRDATLAALVYGGLAALAVGVAMLLRGRARRSPELIGFVLATGVVGAATLLMAFAPDAHPVVAATFTVIPIGTAVFVPWRARTHLGWLATSFAMLLVASLSAVGSEHSGEHWRDFYVGFGMSAVVSIVALLLIDHLRRSGFELERRAFALTARLRAQQRQLQDLNLHLETSVRTDPLTGVGNRLRLDEDLEVLHARLARHGRGFGLVMLDLDRFKGFNDLYGHVTGDEVLRAVAECLGQRVDDAVYRYGGEEFVVLLPEADEAAATGAANRMLRAVAGLQVPHRANAPWGIVTVSAGLAAVGRGDARTADEWLREADAALYRAKGAGRNRAAAAAVESA